MDLDFGLVAEAGLAGDHDEVTCLEALAGFEVEAVGEEGFDQEAFDPLVWADTVGVGLVAVVDEGAFGEEEGIGFGGGDDFGIDVDAWAEGAGVTEGDGDLDEA